MSGDAAAAAETIEGAAAAAAERRLMRMDLDVLPPAVCEGVGLGPRAPLGTREALWAVVDEAGRCLSASYLDDVL